ncbi:MAG: EAL domain-containing protein [Frankiaceae bacterium]|nr:EAL domain-containing protein [Frankiaceae bacterium]
MTIERKRMTREVVLLGLSILVAAFALDWAVLGFRVGQLDVVQPAVLALAVAFAAAEFVVLHIERGRSAFSVSLSELPLIIGLFTVPAEGLVLARVVGGGLVLALHRRQPATKLLFNVCSLAMEVTLAAWVVALMHGSAVDLRHAAPAALVAVLVAATWQSTAVIAAITIYNRRVERGTIIGFARSSAVEVMACWVGGMILLGALRWDPWTLPFVTALAFALMVAYRGYSRLRQRHQSLELLYDFTRRLTSAARSSEEQLADLFKAIAGLLRAESVEMLLLDDAGAPRRLILASDADSVRVTTDVADFDPWLGLIDARAAAVVPAGALDAAGRRLLQGRDLRDLVAVSLPGESGVRGVLGVSNRLGDVASFTADDGKLLQTVTAQVATAFQNSRLVQRLDHESRHDPLTGLANRAHFNECLDQALAKSTKGTAVLLLDLDRFKEVNDTLGHHIGDLLLQQVASRLRHHIRLPDVLARLGGDEFAVFLVDGDADVAVSVASRIEAALAEPLALEGISVEVAASIGIALSPQHGDTAVALLQRADVAMYEAKRTHSGAEIYNEELDGYSPRRLALATELRHAIENGDLELHYQPKADAGSGLVVSAEALVRWNHPQHGLISPVEFVPVAEQTAQIRDLTHFVIDAAVAECASWHRDGMPLSVAVNVSVRNLLDTQLPDYVISCLRKHGLPPAALTLEVTETHIMADPERTMGVLRALDAIGVRLSVDDFGTGYSSLAYLRTLPVREVKIDRSFITHLAEDAGDQAFVRTIVSLAGSLDLDIVAEGVEDDDTWRLLTMLGCTHIQGYFLSRPLPAQVFRTWVTERVTAAPTPVPSPRLSAVASR